MREFSKWNTCDAYFSLQYKYVWYVWYAFCSLSMQWNGCFYHLQRGSNLLRSKHAHTKKRMKMCNKLNWSTEYNGLVHKSKRLSVKSMYFFLWLRFAFCPFRETNLAFYWRITEYYSRNNEMEVDSSTRIVRSREKNYPKAQKNRDAVC